MIALDKVQYIISISREMLEAAPAIIDAELDKPKKSDLYTQDKIMDELGRLIPEDHIQDTLYQNFKATIDGLTDTERYDLVALTWIGRGSYSCNEWNLAFKEAAEETCGRTVEYLLNIPLLPDYLEDAMLRLSQNN